MSKEAMKLALEALENWVEYFSANVDDIDKKAIKDLREALAKPDFWEGYVPEPVKPAQQESVQNNPLDCNVYLGSGKDYAIKHHVSYGPAQQEPVAWISGHRFDELRQGFPVMTTLTKHKAFKDDVAFYTSPPAQRKPLTSEEVSDLRIKHGITSNGRGIKEFTQIVDFVRDIEAAHKIKEQK